MTHVEPTKRAIDTEGLMAWAIGRERADLICEHMMREEPEAFGGSGSCLLAVARYARLGTFVDCSGQPQVEAAHCHPDAEAAYMAAAAVLSTGELYLVRRFAQAGSRPSWRPFHVVTPGPELVFKDGKWKARVRRPGGGVLTLSAMTTGPMAGVLMYADRNMDPSNLHNLKGGAGSTYEGVVYMPSTGLKFTGSSTGVSTFSWASYIARVFHSGGSGEMVVNFVPGASSVPLPVGFGRGRLVQ